MLNIIEPLVRAGFAIHWLHKKSKAPIGDDWSAKPVATFEKLKNSYRTGNNVGVRLGKWSKVDGLYLHVLDTDIRVAGEAEDARERLNELFPGWTNYPTVQSGSGGESRHSYILCSKAFSSKQIANSGKKFTDSKGKTHWTWEIELFGTGKQVAMPPSIHPDSGKPYRWLTPFDLDELALGLGPTVSASHLESLLGDDDDEQIEADDERLKPLGLSVEETSDWLSRLPNENLDYDEWLNVMASVQHEAFGRPKAERQEFYQAFRSWSAQSDKHDNETTRYKFFSFKNKGNRRHRTMRSVQAEVRQIELDAEMENLEDFDEFEDYGDEEPDTKKTGSFDHLFDDEDPASKKAVKPSKREQKLNKEVVEFDLGKGPGKKIQRMNRKHAIAFVNGKTVVITEHDNGDVAYGSLNDLHQWYENDRVPGEKTTEPLSKAWMRSKHRRQFPHGIVFAPGGADEGYYNHWRGFSVEPSADGSCEKFLWHLKHIICNGNMDAYRYALGWFAHMIQKPWEKPGVAMVLRGKKRIGKDTIADYIGSLFRHHHIKVANQEQLTGKFNQHQEKCLLLHVEEGFWAGNKNAEGALKHLITSEKVLIEPKGVNAFTVASVLRLFISSNEDWVVPATVDEGRYFVLDVSEEKRSNHTYFAALKHEMMHGGREALLEYLQNHDLDDFEVRAVPNTVALAGQKAQGLKNLEKWWFAMLESGEPEFQFSLLQDKQRAADWSQDTILVDRQEFQDSYEAWMRKRRFDGEVLPIYRIGKVMGEILDLIESHRKRVDGKQVWHWVIPPLPTCRKAFERWMNSPMIWDKIQPIEHDEPDFEDF